jgi:hypothetical protein
MIRIGGDVSKMILKVIGRTMIMDHVIWNDDIVSLFIVAWNRASRRLRGKLTNAVNPVNVRDNAHTPSVAAALPLAHDFVVGKVDEGCGTFFFVAAMRGSSPGSLFLFLAAGARITAEEVLADNA